MMLHRALLRWIGLVVRRLYRNTPGIGSQEKLATLLMCSRQKISNICRGVEQGLTLVELYDICRVLHIDPICIMPSQKDLESIEQLLSGNEKTDRIDTFIRDRIAIPEERPLRQQEEIFRIFYSNLTNADTEASASSGIVHVSMSELQVPTMEIYSDSFGNGKESTTSAMGSERYVGNYLRISNKAVQCWELHPAQGISSDSMLLFLPTNRRNVSTTVGHILRISDETGVTVVQKCLICQDYGSDILACAKDSDVDFKLLLKPKAIHENHISLSEL